VHHWKVCKWNCERVRVVSCFRDEFMGRVGAEGEKGGETGNGGCVRGTYAAHNDGENVDGGTWPMSSNSIG
jgi:hypothetical protein